MKNIIPFSKELDFSTKLSEITSISLEREFEVHNTSIDGNLFVTGDYKSHEVSANLIPFSFKIPFSIEIPDNIIEDSICLEISDFAYDLLGDSKIKVNIELELCGEEKVDEEQPDDMDILEEPPVVNTDEILEMLEEREEEPIENEKEETITEEVSEVEETTEPQETEVLEESLERTDAMPMNSEVLDNSEDVVLESVTSDEEYATYHIHIVKDGETVETICTMYNSNLNMLADYNDLSNIAAGEKLIIPSNDES